jgi:hypothetical protein
LKRRPALGSPGSSGGQRVPSPGESYENPNARESPARPSPGPEGQAFSPLRSPKPGDPRP